MSTTISVEHVSKTYRLGMIGGATLQEDLSRWWAKVRHKPDPLLKVGQEHHARLIGQEFWALDDVSFNVAQGEVLGIIGRNGAGKSTLLKILSQVTAPTSGRIRIKGRVASLLEVGTGFHPELTGRENIFLNGAIMGMTKAEIRRKLDEIIAFSEIEEFIDTPVKRYSSGMYVRLAFAVAAHLEPEVLIVDEVLSVGDAAFQNKCMGKMNESKGKGRTVLFVSHNMQAVRQLCDSAIYLSAGRNIQQGPSSEVVESYLGDIPRGGSLAEASQVISQLPADPVFRLRNASVLQEGRPTTELVSGKPVEVKMEYELFQRCHGFQAWIAIFDSAGVMIFDSLHNGDQVELETVLEGRYVSTVTIPGDFLAGRPYDLIVSASIHNNRNLLPQPIKIRLNVIALGKTNRAYPGYSSSGQIAPLLSWQTERLSAPHTVDIAK